MYTIWCIAFPLVQILDALNQFNRKSTVFWVLALCRSETAYVSEEHFVSIFKVEE
jgi:hypothetical protein